MSKKFKQIKQTKESIFYENDDYKVKLKAGGYVFQKNNSSKPWYDPQEKEGELIQAYMEEMTVESKKTGRKSTKRVYQEDPIQDLEDDLESKSRFSDIFKKID